MERINYYHWCWILCKKLFGIQNQLLPMLMLLLGTYFSTRILWMQKMRLDFCSQKFGNNLWSLLQFGVHLGSKEKMVQFATIYHLLNHGCLMFKFEKIREIFWVLKIKINGKEHCIDGSGWGMAKAITIFVKWQCVSPLVTPTSCVTCHVIWYP
jgi:hypothetical protein